MAHVHLPMNVNGGSVPIVEAVKRVFHFLTASGVVTKKRHGVKTARVYEIYDGKECKGSVRNPLTDADCGLYVEDYFMEMLSLERKRAERLTNSFLLMIVNIEDIRDTSLKFELARSVSEALSLSMRDTDVKGWYKHGNAVGAIFIDTGAADVGVIRQKFMERLVARVGACLALLKDVTITFYVYPERGNGGGDKERVFDAELYPDLQCKDSSSKRRHFFKRLIDVAGGLCALILFLPFFIVIPVLIKLTSTGPVLFRQKRVGTFGKPFMFLKFRTMHHNNDPRIHSDYIKELIRGQKAYSAGHGGCTYKIKDDPRITSLGRFLRKSSLDELPQFINVLKGEMSLVGPRPPIPYEIENYEIWHLRRLLEVKPGITGLWQVSGRSRTTFNEMVRLDLKYINECSLWLDVKLLLQTPWVIIAGKGAH